MMALFFWVVWLCAACGLIGWAVADDPAMLQGVVLGLLAALALQQIGLEFRKSQETDDGS
jgi:hypothetical protein